jgi:hypothetical protein
MDTGILSARSRQAESAAALVALTHGGRREGNARAMSQGQAERPKPKEAASGRRCAYIELDFVHDEIQPTFWWLGQKLGFEIDFHVHEACVERDVFCRVPGPVRVVPMRFADRRSVSLREMGLEQNGPGDRYDFLVLGTAEPAIRIRIVSESSLPKLLIHHYGFSKLGTPPGEATWCRLGPPAPPGPESPLRLLPLYLGEIEPAEKSSARIFAVPGNLQMDRRNYASLVEALRQLAAQGWTPEDFRVRIVGRWSKQHSSLPAWFHLDGDVLQARLERHGLTDFVELPEREYGYPQFFDQMISSRYVLPLVDDVHPGARRYLGRAHTATISQGLGWLNVPVLHQDLAARLGIDFGFTYERDDLASAMRAALESSEDEERLVRVAQYRERMLRESANAFARWLEGVGT